MEYQQIQCAFGTRSNQTADNLRIGLGSHSQGSVHGPHMIMSEKNVQMCAQCNAYVICNVNALDTSIRIGPNTRKSNNPW